MRFSVFLVFLGFAVLLALPALAEPPEKRDEIARIERHIKLCVEYNDVSQRERRDTVKEFINEALLRREKMTDPEVREVLKMCYGFAAGRAYQMIFDRTPRT